MRGSRVLAGVCLAMLLAGCSTAGNDEAIEPAPAAVPGVERDARSGAGIAAETKSAPRAAAGPAPAADGATTSDAAAGPAGAPGDLVVLADRQVVRDATVEVRVDDLAAATARARAVAAEFGGFVAAEDSTAELTALTLRVAGDRLDGALAALAGLGEQQSRRVATQDVTDQAIDLKARIDSQRAGVQRIRALLDRADTVGEVVAVESELTQRQAELESLQQRAAALADQVALSTVHVQLIPAGPATVDGGGGFGPGLSGGWQALLTVGRVLLTVAGAVLPFAAVLALPVAGIVWWVRRRRPTRGAAVPAPAVADGVPARTD